LTRLADWSLTTRAGPEIGVASTKAFTAQLVVLQLLALYLSKLRRITQQGDPHRLGRLLQQAPRAVEKALEHGDAITALAQRFSGSDSFLYLGRGSCYPIAMEGALKLKEIAYVYAEGLPAGEMKHGPIALIHQGMPAIVIAPRDHVYQKSLGNLEEIKGRGATVLAIGSEGDSLLGSLADSVAFIPSVDSALNPLVATIPIQLFAYHVAVCRGCDVDRPRNLAKTVTVE
jgi:glucosamine--fructose-6-phosphate aminotransferase (isomerizing)